MNIIKDLQCPVCYDIYSGEIFQCRNGHNTCHQCAPRLDRCPICVIEFDNPKMRNLTLASLVQCEDLNVVCYYRGNGCTDYINIKHFSKHIDSCMHNPNSLQLNMEKTGNMCARCNKVPSGKVFACHQAMYCEQCKTLGGSGSCSHCRNMLSDHARSCLVEKLLDRFLPISCPFENKGCVEKIKRGSQQHLAACQYRTFLCEYLGFPGCKNPETESNTYVQHLKCTHKLEVETLGYYADSREEFACGVITLTLKTPCVKLLELNIGSNSYHIVMLSYNKAGGFGIELYHITAPKEFCYFKIRLTNETNLAAKINDLAVSGQLYSIIKDVPFQNRSPVWPSQVLSDNGFFDPVSGTAVIKISIYCIPSSRDDRCRQLERNNIVLPHNLKENETVEGVRTTFEKCALSPWINL